MKGKGDREEIHRRRPMRNLTKGGRKSSSKKLRKAGIRRSKNRSLRQAVPMNTRWWREREGEKIEFSESDDLTIKLREKVTEESAVNE